MRPYCWHYVGILQLPSDPLNETRVIKQTKKQRPGDESDRDGIHNTIFHKPEIQSMKKNAFLYRNSLGLMLFAIFVVLLTGQAYFGWQEHNNEMVEKGGLTVNLREYLGTAHFVEATFENFESEFFQMGIYVLFTIFLRQIGSSESKKLEGKEEVDRVPQPHENAPWPVKKGGLWLTLYSYSLSLAFLLLFFVSFVIHAVSSNREYNNDQILKGEPGETLLEYLGNSRLWFESMQNWQSEFIAVFSIVVLSIFLRQKGSPESKPVDAPYSETGSS